MASTEKKVPHEQSASQASNNKRAAQNDNKDKPAPKRKKRTKGMENREIDEEHSIDPAVARMDGPLLADWIARQTKRFETDLSVVEMEDRRIPEKAFVDTTSWTEARDLQSLPAFIERFSKKSKQALSNSSEAKGSPHTIVVAASGMRAADLTRTLRVYQTKTAMVAKLFAKHIKIKEAVEMTGNSRMSMGIGTPQRLLDLIELGALSLKHVTHIVVDGSHVDQKKLGVLSIRDTAVPLVRLLARAEVKARYGEGAKERIEIMVY